MQKIPEFVRQAGRKPVEFQPYRVEDFEAAHSPAYVKGILSCTLKNGFGTLDSEINQALRYPNACLGAHGIANGCYSACVLAVEIVHRRSQEGRADSLEWREA